MEHEYIFVEKPVYYCGRISKIVACALIFVCCPLAPFVYFCPCDIDRNSQLRNKLSLILEEEEDNDDNEETKNMIQMEMN